MKQKHGDGNEENVKEQLVVDKPDEPPMEVPSLATLPSP